MKTPNQIALNAVGTELAHGRFADLNQIVRRQIDFASGVLDIGESYLSSESGKRTARVLNDLLSKPLIADPFVRIFIRRVIKSLQGLASDHELEDAIDALCSMNWQSSKTVSSDVISVSILDPRSSASTTVQRLNCSFNALLDKELTGRSATFAYPTEEVKFKVFRALSILNQNAPSVANSALGHVAFLVFYDVVDGDTSSGGDKVNSLSLSSNTLPGAIFLSSGLLQDTTLLAEHILHEALHSKIFSLYDSHRLLANSYEATTSPHIAPWWHPDGVLWPTDQALGAAHVYVYLTYFLLTLRKDRTEPCSDSAKFTMKASDYQNRARFLLEQSAHASRTTLTINGQNFVDWLFSILLLLVPMIDQDSV